MYDSLICTPLFAALYLVGIYILLEYIFCNISSRANLKGHHYLLRSSFVPAAKDESVLYRLDPDVTDKSVIIYLGGQISRSALLLLPPIYICPPFSHFSGPGFLSSSILFLAAEHASFALDFHHSRLNWELPFSSYD